MVIFVLATSSMCSAESGRAYTCEQVLFVYVFTIILSRLTDPRNFITVREPEQTTLLF